MSSLLYLKEVYTDLQFLLISQRFKILHKIPDISILDLSHWFSLKACHLVNIN